MDGTLLTYLICRDNKLIDLVGKTTWTNTAEIVDGGVFGEQCLFFASDGRAYNDQVIHYVYANQYGLFDFGKSDWTISFWFKLMDLNKLNLFNTLIGGYPDKGQINICIRDNLLVNLSFGSSNTSSHDYDFYADNYSPIKEGWNYFTITRYGAFIYQYMNGIINNIKQVGKDYNMPNDGSMALGRWGPNGQHLLCNGYIDHFSVFLGRDNYHPNFDNPIGFGYRKPLLNNLSLSE